MNWLKNLYEKMAFQRRYDEIKSWELPTAVDEAFEYIWASIPSAIQASVMRTIKEVYNEYGKDFAIKLLKDILDRLLKMVAVQVK